MNIALKSRNFNAKISAIGLSILFVWVLYEKFTMPELVNRDDIDAIIVEIKTPNTKSSNKSLIILKVKFSDNKHCKLFTKPRSKFKLGRTIPITVEEYDDKSKICFINQNLFNML